MPSGQVTAVTEHLAGSELTQAPDVGGLFPSTALYPSTALWPSSSTQLSVVDINEFDHDGGYVNVGGVATGSTLTGGEQVAYVIPPGSDNTDGSGVLDLTGTLAGSYVQGDPVYQVDINGTTFPERWCYFIESDGEEELAARVPHTLVALLTVGIRDPDAAEVVQAAEDGTDIVITDVLGKTPRYHLDLEAATDAADPDDVVNWYHADGHRVARIRVQTNVADPNDNQMQVTVNPDAALGGVSVYISDLDVSVEVPDGLGGFKQRTILDYLGLSNFLLDDAWQNWTPTLSGWSANPTNTVYRYKQMGKMVIASIRQTTNGTSNATTKSISAPVTAATISNMIWAETCSATDNGVGLATSSGASIASGSSTINFSKDLSTTTGGWTASGGHKIQTCTLIYEAA